MNDSDELVRRIHAADGQVVLALNGGSRALAELLEVPGGSKTLLEAAVPYSEGALTAWLGSRPEQFCSSRTARAMAVVAFVRAIRFGAAELQAAGVSCTASLATDRPKRGPHRVHVAVQTAGRMRHCWLQFDKYVRNRRDQEQIVSRLLLNAAADAVGVDERLELPLLPHERLETEETTAPLPWQDLFLGRAEKIPSPPAPLPKVEERSLPAAIFPGAFDPLHAGHRRMAAIAAEVLGLPVAMEISILNVDKPALDYLEIARRLQQFPTEQAVWLTRTATFDDKSRLFPGATFIVGADTLRRIIDPRYYGGNQDAMLQAIQRIVGRDCRFLVFGRTIEADFIRLADMGLPELLRGACDEIPQDKFREDISSTALRKP